MLPTEITENPQYSFPAFFFKEFSKAVYRVEGKFLPGHHLYEWCAILQGYSHTVIESARLFLKSTVHLAYVAWALYKMEHIYDDWEYMGYVEDLSFGQLKRLKRYINALPELYGDHKELTDAQGVLWYGKDGKEFFCQPSGILTFKRGRHPRVMIIDDILKDPEKRLDLTQLEKIERTFFEEVELMPTEELHLTGTKQDRLDLFSKIATKKKYFYRSYPAEKRGVPLWPENFSKEKLIEIHDTIGDKAYRKEMMCSPVRAEEGFFKEEQYDALVRNRLNNYDLHHPVKFNNGSYGGFDIGKKSHPSHFFILTPDRKGKLIQTHSKWMDGWDYKEQIAYCKQAIAVFGIITLMYDDTRAEFEGFKEVGQLPPQMKGLTFTAKEKFEMASEVDTVVTQDGIRLLPEERQKRQMLNVDNDLQAVQTAEGHGDCFFSLCLAIKAYRKGKRQMIYEIG